MPDFSAQAALRKGQLVAVLPGWKPVGAFAETIYAIRPYAPHVPRAVTALVGALRTGLAQLQTGQSRSHRRAVENPKNGGY
jgi:hypothetical protein